MSLYDQICAWFGRLGKRRVQALPVPDFDETPTTPTAVPAIERTDGPEVTDPGTTPGARPRAPPPAPEVLEEVEVDEWISAPPEAKAAAPTPKDLDPEKRRIVWSVLSVFETGRPEGNYSAVAVLADGAGISYGKHQATDRSDTVDAIVLRYLDLGGGIFGERLRPFLSFLADDASARLDPLRPDGWPQEAKDLMRLLSDAGEDPVMRLAQDQVFAEQYWEPCRSRCLAMGLVLPLSWAAIYDTTIQSGPAGVENIRKRFPEVPPAGGGSETAWTRAYLEARKSWISTFHNAAHPERNATVRSTTYRAESLLDLADEGNWELLTPVKISKPAVKIW